MSVHYGLARREAVVNADIETIRLQTCEQPLANLQNQFPDPFLLSVAEFVQAGYVLARENERVALTYGVRIRDSHRVLCINPEPFGPQEAKWAVRQTGSITRTLCPAASYRLAGDTMRLNRAFDFSSFVMRFFGTAC